MAVYTSNYCCRDSLSAVKQASGMSTANSQLSNGKAQNGARNYTVLPVCLGDDFTHWQLRWE